MLRYLVDESVHGDIVRALLRRDPNLALATVEEVGWRGAEDPVILERAAVEGRVVISSDVSTLIGDAYARVRAGQPMPGVFVVHQGTSIGPIVDDLLLAAGASIEGEWDGQIRYLPF